VKQRIGSGVITPLLTPINQDESVNYEQMRSLIDYVIDGGVDAVFVMGSSGEFARFDPQTRGNVLKESVKAVADRVPVYAGVADTGLSSVLRNVSQAEEAGVDVLVVTLPYYFPIYNDDEAYSFFSSVAASTKLPVMLYDIPSTCGASISFEVMDRLFSIGNIVGIKDSSGNLEKLQEILRRYKNRGKDFAVTVGDEQLCYDGLLSGADGIVPSLSNPYPKLLADICRAAKASNEPRLRELCDVVNQMNRLNGYCNAWMSPNVWRKKALSNLGICNEYCTQPYVPVDSQVNLKIIEATKMYHEMYDCDSGTAQKNRVLPNAVSQ